MVFFLISVEFLAEFDKFAQNWCFWGHFIVVSVMKLYMWKQVRVHIGQHHKLSPAECLLVLKKVQVRHYYYIFIFHENYFKQ